MVRKAANKGTKKTLTVTKSLQGNTKSELLKEGKTLGLFEGITGKKLAAISKDEMIRQIIDAQALASKEEEIVIGEKPKTATKVARKKVVKRGKVAKKAVVPKKASSDYQDKAVSTLLKLCKERGIAGCVGKKSMLKKNLVPLLEAWDDEHPEGLKKVVVKKASVKKAPAKKAAVKKAPAKKAVVKKAPVKKAVVVREDCTEDQVLVLETGKCIKKTKSGAPYGEATLKKKYGDDYVYDDELRVVGRKAEVDSYRSEMSGDARCDDEEDALECDEGDVCSADTGKCVTDTAAVRKGTSELKVADRIIIGDAATIKKLQGILGGTITSPVKPKAQPKVLKKVVAKKVVKKTSPKEMEDLGARLDDLLSEEGDASDIADIRKRIQKEKEEKKKPLPVPPAKKKPLPVPKKKVSPKKKTPTPQKKTSPKKKTPTPKKPVTGFKTELKKQEIYETFQKCLASLQA